MSNRRNPRRLGSRRFEKGRTPAKVTSSYEANAQNIRARRATRAKRDATWRIFYTKAGRRLLRRSIRLGKWMGPLVKGNRGTKKRRKRQREKIYQAELKMMERP